MKAEPAILKGALECRDQLAAKNAAEHLDGKKEGVAWFDPARVIGRESTGRHHAMHMRMKVEVLTPGVQHAEEADFSAAAFGIAGDFENRLRTSAKQKRVADLLILQSQRG